MKASGVAIAAGVFVFVVVSARQPHEPSLVGGPNQRPHIPTLNSAGRSDRHGGFDLRIEESRDKPDQNGASTSYIHHPDHHKKSHLTPFQQKALKTLAAKNTQTLNRTHLISLAVNTLYFLLRFFLSLRRSLLLYILISLPALLIEFWFERIARPTYTSPSSGEKDLKRAGEDLEAKGLTEWMWDLVYWTWACVVLVTLFGDWAWWAWAAVPAYSGWLAWSTYTGARSGLGGMMGGTGGEGAGGAGGQSKRQAKMEKRGGQKMVYR